MHPLSRQSEPISAIWNSAWYTIANQPSGALMTCGWFFVFSTYLISESVDQVPQSCRYPAQESPMLSASTPLNVVIRTSSDAADADWAIEFCSFWHHHPHHLLAISLALPWATRTAPNCIHKLSINQWHQKPNNTESKPWQHGIVFHPESTSFPSLSCWHAK